MHSARDTFVTHLSVSEGFFLAGGGVFIFFRFDFGFGVLKPLIANYEIFHGEIWL